MKCCATGEGFKDQPLADEKTSLLPTTVEGQWEKHLDYYDECPVNEDHFFVRHPRLRRSGNSPLAYDAIEKTSKGLVSVNEGLWQIMITLSLSHLRFDLIKSYDIIFYILQWFMIWGPVSAAIRYSASFNDTDAYHLILWSCFFVAIAVQMMGSGTDLTMFAGGTSAMYAVVAVAYWRVACGFPELHRQTYIWMGISILKGVLFVPLMIPSLTVDGAHSWLVRGIMYFHALFGIAQTICHAIWKCCYPDEEDAPDGFQPRSWWIPFSLRYYVKHRDGLMMMAFSVGFLRPLALEGPQFNKGGEAAAIILLGATYALLLKVAYIDLRPKDQDSEAALARHALSGTPMASAIYLGMPALHILSIGLVGVGFAMGITDTVDSYDHFAVQLLCYGSAAVWFQLALDRAVQRPVGPLDNWSDLKKRRMTIVWRAYIFLEVLGGFTFMLPLCLSWKIWHTGAYLVGVEGTIILLQLVSRAFIRRKWGTRWSVASPRPLMEWYAPQGSDENIDHKERARALEKNQRSESGRSALLPQSHEVFFNVFFACGVNRLGCMILYDHDVMGNVLYFFCYYFVLENAMTYASRYNDSDLLHKFYWTAFGFAFLLMDLGSNPVLCKDQTHRWLLFPAACGAFNLLTGLLHLRVVLVLGLCQGHHGHIFNSGLCFTFCSIRAIFLFSWCYDQNPKSEFVTVMLWALLLTLPLERIVKTVWRHWNPAHSPPLNIGYCIARNNQIYMAIIAVSVLQQNMVNPGKSTRLLVGIACTAINALCFKTGIIDLGSRNEETHAMGQGHLPFVAHSYLLPVTFCSLTILGLAMHMIMKSIADHSNDTSSSRFTQALLCLSSATLWGALAGIRLCHKWVHRSALQWSKIVIQGIAAIVIGCLALIPTLDDISMLIIVTTIVLAQVAAQVVLKVLYDEHYELI